MKIIGTPFVWDLESWYLWLSTPELQIIKTCIIGNRCLKEGAEEFFLKPVRLSDVNRLRPHMMKTKLKDPKQENLENKEESGKPESRSQEEKEEQQHHHQQQLHHLSQQQHSNSNKRKALEEGLSPDRTRPRYNGLTTVVWWLIMGNNLSFDLNICIFFFKKKNLNFTPGNTDPIGVGRL